MSRAILTFVAGVVVGVGGSAPARHGDGGGKGPASKAISAVDIDEEVSGKKARATTLEVTFAPGVASTPHRHPGPVFGYVLEGELEFQAGEAPAQRLKAGDAFYEPTMVLHTVSRNPSEKARTRVLAVMLHAPDAKAPVIPEPETGGK